MKPAFFHTTHSLKQRDFFLLADVFRQVVRDLLPVDATILFWCSKWKHRKKEIYSGPVKNWKTRLDAQCKAGEPGFILDMLVFPLEIDDGSKVAVLVRDVDPDLVRKMDHEWLCELRDSLQENLEIKRRQYVDNVTGLYDNRFLAACLEQCDHAGSGVLFLVGIGNRSGKLTVNLVKTVEAGLFIESVTNGAVFYLGGNIFAVLNDALQRQEALGLARRLLSRLKREGVHNVHIGILRIGGGTVEKVRPQILNECWQALEAAEMRGPFSLCEASVLVDRERHPLALPPMEAIAQLRKKWKGLKRFGLILVSVDNVQSGLPGSFDLSQVLVPLLPPGTFYVPVAAAQGYALVPDQTEKQALKAGRKLAKEFSRAESSLSCSVGVCHWPALNYTKTEMTVNCRKALMHGSFFGPGAVTLFDHVSLNVSGDYYFDEGDYRLAVRDYRTGCRIAPDDINLMNSLGVALIELNRLKEAVSYFDKVLELVPDNFMALVNKGFALRRVGSDTEALKCLEHASRHKEFGDSDVFSEISLQLGRLYCNRGLYGKAVRILEQLDRKKPEKQDPGLLRLLGEAYAGNGDNSRAILLLQRAIRMYPQDAVSLSILGELYAHENQGNEIALSLCEQAVEIDEGPWEYWFRLALVRNKMGMERAALNALQKCFRRNRKAAEAFYLAADIYKGLGEQKKSAHMYRRARKIDHNFEKQAG